MHYVIIIPGLGDNSRLIALGTSHWNIKGFSTIVHAVGWHDDEKDFNIKLTRILNLIDSLSSNGNLVSLVGCSAGASAVMNAFSQRKYSIYKVVSVCGKLRTGDLTGYRSFDAKTATSETFAQSVKLSEQNLELFSDGDKQKVMTVSAMFGDQLVPRNTSTLVGAYNYIIPTGEHLFSISMALTLFSKKILNFLH